MSLFTPKAQEILLLLASPEVLLSVGGKFECTIKSSAQVLVLLHKLYIPPMDCADGSYSQLPLLTGKGHHHLFGLITPFHKPMPHWAVMMMWGAWEQGQEKCVICILYQMTVWMGGPSVISVKGEEQRWEDTALRGACRGDRDVREYVIDQHPLWSAGQKVCNPEDQLVVQVEAFAIHVHFHTKTLFFHFCAKTHMHCVVLADRPHGSWKRNDWKGTFLKRVSGWKNPKTQPSRSRVDGESIDIIYIGAS